IPIRSDPSGNKTGDGRRSDVLIQREMESRAQRPLPESEVLRAQGHEIYGLTRLVLRIEAGKNPFGTLFQISPRGFLAVGLQMLTVLQQDESEVSVFLTEPCLQNTEGLPEEAVGLIRM